MTKKRLRTITVMLSLTWMSVVAFADGDIVAGKTKAEVCAACHGPNGNSTNPIYPSLAGQNQRYLIEQLLDFQQGEKSGRNNPVMTGLVANLSKQDIADLAAYFSVQPRSYGKADPKLVTLGQLIYRGGNMQTHTPACAACHGPRGFGNAEAGFPALGGLQADYVVAQLTAYKKGERHNDINSIMQNVAAKLSDDEMKAVASYISGLH